jgi:outer membrane receptor protein involved in Fe transport
VDGFGGWSAKIGADAALAGPFSARASAGRTFRAPTVTELYLQQGVLQPNPALVPEEGWSADAGVAAEGRLGLARAGVFAALYRDLIVYEPATFQRLKPFNAGRAAVRGAELEAASTPRGPLGAAGAVAYTYLASENLRGDEAVLGKDLPHRARHRLFARGSLARGPAGAHVELHHVGAQFQDRRNLVGIPAATTWNAGASWRFSRRPELTANVELRNLLDARDLQDPFGNPLPGRMALVSLRAGFAPGGSP